jgi:NAD(P)-dependent dehydrogenase (short-subunit alcohol dehydrogenase family)
MLPEGHVTAIVGAGGGIGQALCRVFAVAGSSVRALDKDVNAAAANLTDLSGNHQAFALDVTDADAVDAAAKNIGHVDAVIYAPGVVFTANVADLDWHTYHSLMKVNLDGAFFVAKAFVRGMLARGSGSFVFLSSMAGKRGEAGASAYCASKFAIIGLVQSFAAEVAAAGIRVNAVCPGNVDTPMLQRVAADIAKNTDSDVTAIWQEMKDVAAAKRLVTPAEVAQSCLWLCSPLASGVTGEAINVDAGALSG